MRCLWFYSLAASESPKAASRISAYPSLTETVWSIFGDKAGGFHDWPPLFDIGPDEFCEIFGALARSREPEGGEAIQHFFVLEAVSNDFIQPSDQRRG